MDISQLTPAEALEAITAMETVDELRVAATSINVTFSGNTGEGTLRKKVIDNLKAKQQALEDEDEDEIGSLFGNEVEEIQVAPPIKKKEKKTVNDLLTMDPNTVEDPLLRRQIVRAQALRLVRIKLSNLDPSDSQLEGAIITVSNKYTGKVSKYVPFNEDAAPNGYHVPMIIYNHLKNQKFALRKEVKGGSFGVKRYKTSMINKFSIEVLPQLTARELAELASHQRASHAIDN
jgi:hypothetical protein